jgi:hypothetical protein
MNNLLKPYKILSILLIAIILSSMTSIAAIQYTAWDREYTSISASNVSGNVIDAEGLGASWYANGTVGHIQVCSTYYINSTPTNVTLYVITDSQGNELGKYVLNISGGYSEVVPAHIEVSMDGKFVAVMGTARKTGTVSDYDGFLYIISDNSTFHTGDIYEGPTSPGDEVWFFSGVYGINDHIYVVGTYYNNTSGNYMGLLLDYYFNNGVLTGIGGSLYTFTDPDGYSNNLMFTDAVIGPDGYLYVAGYIPYYAGGVVTDVYEYKVALIKIHPGDYSVLGYDLLSVWNNQYKRAQYAASVTSDDSNIYAAFNSISNDYYLSTNVTIIKYETNLTKDWVKYWNEVNYDDYAFDILATNRNLTIVGGTYYWYLVGGSVDKMNMVVFSLNKTDGSTQYGLMIGGLENEYFNDVAVDNVGGVYVLGPYNSTSLGGYLITGQVSVSRIPSSGTRTADKPIGVLRTILYESMIAKNNTGSASNRLVSKSLNSNSEGETYITQYTILPGFTTNDTQLQMFSLITPRGGVRGFATNQIPTIANAPGLLAKLNATGGTQNVPPNPLPEEEYLVMAVVVATLAAIFVIFKKRSLV